MTHILIVDDAADFRRSIAQLLQFEGFTVTQADSPLNAFAQMRQHRPDLILSDLSFLGLDDANFICRVRGNLYFANIPIIVVSGFGDIEHIDQALAFGANDYLVKPFTMTKLLESIQRQLYSTPLKVAIPA